MEKNNTLDHYVIKKKIFFSRREPKRLLVPRVEKAKSSQSFDYKFDILLYYFW